MKTSWYFDRVLFHNQSPATAQFFNDRSDQIFEAGIGNSFIDIDVQIPLQAQLPDGSQYGLGKTYPESSAEPPPHVDHHDYLESQPPRYVESPRFYRLKITNPAKLSEIAKSSKNCFRVCFIHQRHSYSRLQVTRELFETLMLEFNILPRFKDFVLFFGAKKGENEISPPPLRFRRLSDAGSGHRGFAGFECAYGLRHMELNYRGRVRLWSLRQTVIYHSYKMDGKLSTWVIVSPSRSAGLCLDRYARSAGDLAGLNPFEVHLIILDFTLANWRPYIVSLTEEIREQSDRVLVASVYERDKLRLLDVEEYQVLKNFEDQIIDIFLALDSTFEAVTSLMGKYTDFLHEIQDTPENRNDLIFDSISLALQEKQREVTLSRRTVESLHKKVQETTRLLSSLLGLGNGYSLKQIAEEARRENIVTRQLTEKGTQDAAAVKVLTIITLIYLPATVVSNFFSTQFVHQQESTGRMTVSSNVWIFVAVSVPLTLATLMMWWLWVRIQARQIRPSKEGPKSYV